MGRNTRYSRPHFNHNEIWGILQLYVLPQNSIPHNILNERLACRFCGTNKRRSISRRALAYTYQIIIIIIKIIIKYFSAKCSYYCVVENGSVAARMCHIIIGEEDLLERFFLVRRCTLRCLSGSQCIWLLFEQKVRVYKSKNQMILFQFKIEQLPWRWRIALNSEWYG